MDQRAANGPTISFDEFVMAFFLTGTEQTLPIFIFSQLRFANRLPGVVALGAAIIMVSIVVVAFAEWTRRRGTYGRSEDTGM